MVSLSPKLAANIGGAMGVSCYERSVRMGENMQSFMPTTLPGAGHVTGVFWNADRSLLAVACHYDKLDRPNGRASYSGQSLYQAVMLYRVGSAEPVATFQDLYLPVHHIAFHPTQPVIAIGGGDYDGGSDFMGELVLFNWQTGQNSNAGRAVPEVMWCGFEDEGDSLNIVTRPWHDEQFSKDGTGHDPWNTYLSDKLENIGTVLAGNAKLADLINLPYGDAVPLEDNAPELAPLTAQQSREELQQELTQAFGKAFVSRSAIWDIKWLPDGTLAAAHDDCLMDVFDADGSLISHYAPEAAGEMGVQILISGTQVLLHSNHELDEDEERASAYKGSKLYEVAGNELLPLRSFSHDYVFSASGQNALLGRCDKVGWREGAGKDVIITGSGAGFHFLDLGNYDCFNHWARFDGADRYYFIQGTPRESHKGKHLCSVDADGKETVHWPLLSSDEHAMELATCYGRDSLGPAIVIAGLYHGAPSPKQPDHGFLYRRSPDRGEDVWRHAVPCGASTLAFHPDRPLVACAFLNGEVWFIHSESGEVLKQIDRFAPDGCETVVYSLDMAAGKIAFGCLDGRILVYTLTELGLA